MTLVKIIIAIYRKFNYNFSYILWKIATLGKCIFIDVFGEILMQDKDYIKIRVTHCTQNRPTLLSVTIILLTKIKLERNTESA